MQIMKHKNSRNVKEGEENENKRRNTINNVKYIFTKCRIII